MTSKVRFERDGPITTVVINRPEVRNAVDNETAEALADARYLAVPIRIIRRVLSGEFSLDAVGNRRVVENEVKKLDSAGKRDLAKTLMEQADKDEAKEPAAKA